MTLQEAFSQVRDHRRGPAVRHDLKEMIVMAICAVLCGCDDWVFDIKADEALILESEVPRCNYWNIQLTDELYAPIDYVNRQTSLNGFSARLDMDGKFRAVISAQDPGVPNWLDDASYERGMILGRWTECDATPTPVIPKVKAAEVRKYLPADTPTVSAADRDSSLRLRRKAAQMRRRW